MKKVTYIGIDKDPTGAMNHTGNIIRDAWVFGIIPETETCEGWNSQGLDDLYSRVSEAWKPYGHIKGWDPDAMLENES